MQLIYNVDGSPEIHLDVLKAICGDTSDKTMIDLCCGFAPQTRQLGFKERRYFDIVKRDLAEEMPYFHQMEVVKYAKFISPKSDVVFLLDALEHFDEFTADMIWDTMYLLGRKRVVFAPLGDYLIEKEPTNNPDTHKSGHLPENFPECITIVFNNFHPTLGIGAFFVCDCENNEQEFERIKSELNQKSWAK